MLTRDQVIQELREMNKNISDLNLASWYYLYMQTYDTPDVKSIGPCIFTASSIFEAILMVDETYPILNWALTSCSSTDQIVSFLVNRQDTEDFIFHPVTLL